MRRYAITGIRVDTYKNQNIVWYEFDDPFTMTEFLNDRAHIKNLFKIHVLYEEPKKAVFPIKLDCEDIKQYSQGICKNV